MTIIGGIVLIIIGVVLMYISKYITESLLSTIVRVIGILFILVGIIVLIVSLFSGIALF
jgi:hypothetical protein